MDDDTPGVTPPAPAPAPAAPAPAPANDPPAPAPTPAAPSPAPTPAAVEYKFNAPDGFELNQPALEKFTAIAKAKGLSQEDAQSMVDIAVGMQQEQLTLHKQTVEGWQKEVKTGKRADGSDMPEHLRFPQGDQFEPSLAIAKKALDASPPELKQLLNDTGMGNHPAVLMTFLKFGKMMAQDGFVPSGGGASGGTDSFETRADRMYSNSK